MIVFQVHQEIEEAMKQTNRGRPTRPINSSLAGIRMFKRSLTPIASSHGDSPPPARRARTEIEIALRRIRSRILIIAIASLLVAAPMTYALYLEFHPPTGVHPRQGWWDWVRSAGQSWDPVSAISTLLSIAMPLVIATFVARAADKSDDNVPQETSRAAAVIAAEGLTLIVCICASVTAWMTLPAAVSATSAPGIKSIVVVGAALVFASLAAIAQPSSTTRRHVSGSAASRRQCLQQLLEAEDSVLAGSTSTHDGERLLANRSQRTSLTVLTLLGAAYGLVLAAIHTVWFIAVAHFQWELILAAAIYLVVDAAALAWFAYARVQLRINSQLDGRLTNFGETLALGSIGTLYFLSGFTIALSGQFVAAVLWLAFVFGPPVIYVRIRSSLVVRVLRRTVLQRRLSALLESAGQAQPVAAATRGSSTTTAVAPRPMRRRGGPISVPGHSTPSGRRSVS